MGAIGDMVEKTKEKNGKNVLRGKLWVLFVVAFVIAGICVTSIVAYGKSYEGRVLPGLHIGDVPIGGMTETELFDFLELMNSRLSQEGIHLNFAGGEEPIDFVLYPAVVPDDNVYDLVSTDASAETNRFLAYGHSGGAFSAGVAALVSRFTEPAMTLEHITIDSEQLAQQVREHVGEYEQEARDANVVVNNVISDTEVDYTFVTSSLGVTVDFDDLSDQLIASWEELEFPEVTITMIKQPPSVTKDDLESVVERLPQIFANGSLDITYTDPHTKRDRSWKITASALTEYIEVQPTDDGAFIVGMNREAFDAYLDDNVAELVEVDAVDAKFEVGSDGKVSQFRGSRPGVSIDREATYGDVNDAIHQRYWHDEGVVSSVALTTEVAEPNVKTGEVNDLGISELLGTGYSNFSGSPPNRVKNVRFAIDTKLNGTIIKPGETFSLLDALRPFTIEGGYLPELVIKGDEIKPEVGGGLCQVGSTMFRAAMNSGMEITERRNHSLVVNYYNDHRNGKPGTDATIYDAAPDFKFTNTTDGHLLLTTKMNEKTGDLWFSLWGTNPGKRGYYTEPVVHNWIAAGPDRITKTTELAPGTQKCQSAHPGAVTSFTYVIEHEDGTKEEEVFRSHYRPLPRICLVGVTEEELAAEEAGEGEDGEDGDDEGEEEADEDEPAEDDDSPVSSEDAEG